MTDKNGNGRSHPVPATLRLLVETFGTKSLVILLCLLFISVICIGILGGYALYTYNSRENYENVAKINALQLANLEKILDQIDKLNRRRAILSIDISSESDKLDKMKQQYDLMYEYNEFYSNKVKEIYKPLNDPELSEDINKILKKK